MKMYELLVTTFETSSRPGMSAAGYNKNLLKMHPMDVLTAKCESVNDMEIVPDGNKTLEKATLAWNLYKYTYDYKIFRNQKAVEKRGEKYLIINEGARQKELKEVFQQVEGYLNRVKGKHAPFWYGEPLIEKIGELKIDTASSIKLKTAEEFSFLKPFQKFITLANLSSTVITKEELISLNPLQWINSMNFDIPLRLWTVKYNYVTKDGNRKFKTKYLFTNRRMDKNHVMNTLLESVENLSAAVSNVKILETKHMDLLIGA